MADHMYKFSEVEKGKKWQHFLEYYKKPTLLAIFLLILLGFYAKNAFFTPKDDVYILAAAETMVSYAALEQAEEAFKDMELDFNEDGKSLVTVDFVHLDKGDPDIYSSAQTKFMASLTSVDGALVITDEALFSYLEREGLVETWAELSEHAEGKETELIKIPLSELSPFSENAEKFEGLFLTLRTRDTMHIGENEKKAEDYEKQKQALLKMLSVQ